MMDARTWEYLPLEIAPVVRQMAIDAAMVEACAQGRLTAALRLYRMTPGGVTIGRHQRWASVIDVQQLARHGWEWARRPTGGGALLHHRELNYVVVIARPAIAALGGEGLRNAFAIIMQGFVAALRSLGARPELHLGEREMSPSAAGVSHGLCERSLTRHEISIDGLKAVASAQLTLPDAILQHGTIYFVRPSPDDRFWPKAQLEEIAPKWWDLNGILEDTPAGVAHMEGSIKRGFADALEVRFRDHTVLPVSESDIRQRINLWSEQDYHRRR